MNKEKLLCLLTELETHIAACKKDVRSDWLPKTILGAPVIVHDLQSGVVKIMLAAQEKA